jgi:hypothetical protein
MANLREMLAGFMNPGFSKEAPPPAPAESQFDRIDYDLLGSSDVDAMWYYEVRKWRGRD